MHSVAMRGCGLGTRKCRYSHKRWMTVKENENKIRFFWSHATTECLVRSFVTHFYASFPTSTNSSSTTRFTCSASNTNSACRHLHLVSSHSQNLISFSAISPSFASSSSSTSSPSNILFMPRRMVSAFAPKKREFKLPVEEIAPKFAILLKSSSPLPIKFTKLLRIMEMHPQNLEMQLFGFGIICQLLQRESDRINGVYHATFAEASGLTLLLSLMKRHPSVEKLQAQGLTIIQHTTVLLDYKDQFMAFGGFRVIFRALLNHRDCPEIVNRVSGNLFLRFVRIYLRQFENVRSISDETLPYILDLVSYHKDNNLLVTAAFRATRKMVRYNSKATAEEYSNVVIEKLSAALRQYPDAQPLHYLTLQIFFNLLYWGFNFERIVQANGVELILKSMQLYPGSEPISITGAMSLYPLMSQVEVRRRFRAANGIPTLLSTLFKHPTYTSLSYYIWLTLKQSDYEYNLENLIACGGVEGVVAKMQNYPSNRFLQNVGGNILKAIAESEPTVASHVLEANAVDLIIKATTDSSDSVLYELYSWNFYQLSEDMDYNKIVESMRSNEHDHSVVQQGCRIFRKIAQAGIYVEAIVAAGCIEVLLAALRHFPILDIAEDVCCTLRDIAKMDPTYCDIIVNARGIEDLLIAMKRNFSAEEIIIPVASATLRLICKNKAHLPRVIEADGVRTLTEAMALAEEDGDITFQISALLQSIADCGDEPCRTIAKSGAISALLRALDAFPNEINIQLQCIGCLSKILQLADDSYSLLDANFLPMIERSLNQFPASMLLHTHASRTIAYMSGQSTYLPPMIQNRALELLLKAMRRFRHDTTIINFVLITLSNLSTNLKGFAEIVRTNALARLMESPLTSNHKKSSAIHARVKEIIQNLLTSFDEEDTLKIVTSSSGLEMFVKVLCAFPDNVTIQSLICKSFLAASAQPEIAIHLLNSPAFKLIRDNSRRYPEEPVLSQLRGALKASVTTEIPQQPEKSSDYFPQFEEASITSENPQQSGQASDSFRQFEENIMK